MSQSIDDRIGYLLKQYIAGSCDYNEYQELLALLKVQTDTRQLEELLLEEVRNSGIHESESNVNWQQMLQTVLQQQAMGETEDHRTPVRRMGAWQRVAAAAAIIIMLSAGAWYFLMRTPKTEVARTEDTRTVEQRIAAAGHNKAMLTLADNSTIILESAANGQLATQGKTTVIKSTEGQLTYTLPVGQESRGEALYNTLATPRGGQYQLILPDGSKVWLNATSSIRYPTAFTGSDRRVDITGEAYFEVAPVRLRSGQKMPFRVHFVSAGREGAVEVLGTHFNINAYEDEPVVKTTLLEGSVKVKKEAAAVILKPGEQTSISQKSQPSHPIPVQTDEIVAWKEGLFKFKGEDIKTVMRQIGRWYDVEVVHEDEIKEEFYTKIKRDTEFADVLKILETTGAVHFRMEGKKVVVTK